MSNRKNNVNNPSDLTDLTQRLHAIYQLLMDNGLMQEAKVVEEAAIQLLSYAAFFFHTMDSKNGVNHQIH